MSDREKKAVMEALLFVWGDPLPIKDIADILGIDLKHAKALLSDLKEEMDHSRRGLTLRWYDQSVQLTTRREHEGYLSQLYRTKKPKRLSNSAMECLALVAYKQPVTRMEIDAIRGVNSSGAMETLLRRGLVEEAGRLDQVGRPILYQTGLQFLQDFDLQSLEELPDLDRLRQSLSREEEGGLGAD